MNPTVKNENSYPATVPTTVDLPIATVSDVADYAAAKGLGFSAAYQKLLATAIQLSRLEERAVQS